MQSTTDDRMDMSRLEEVSTNTKVWFVVTPLVVLAFVVFAGWLMVWHGIGRHAEQQGVSVVGVGLAILLLGTVVAVTVATWWAGYWKTDNLGIRKVGLFSESFLPWDDITNADSLYQSSPGKREIHLEIDGRKITVSSPDPKLAASIFLHLERRGKADQIKLPPELQSLFTPPADEPVAEINWILKHRLAWWRTLATAAMTLAMLILSLVTIYEWLTASAGHHSSIVLAIWVLLQLPNYVIYTLRGTFTATAFSLCQDHFAVTTIWGAATYRWEDLKTACWSGSWDGDTLLEKQPGVPSPSRIALALQVGKLRVFYIPWDSRDRESTKLLLAIQERLRQMPGTIVRPSPKPELTLNRWHIACRYAWANPPTTELSQPHRRLEEFPLPHVVREDGEV